MKHLFFDFDGTIADSEVGILNGIRYMIDKMGLTPLDDATYRTFIGPSLSASLNKYYPELTQDQVNQTIGYYQEIYTKTGIFELELYPGIVDALAEMKAAGYQLHVASAKPEVMIERIVAHFNLGQYFTGLYGATLDEGIRSTKTQVLAYAIEQSQADPTQSVMIGDRDNDMLGGAANHLPTVGVLYGFGSEGELTESGAKALAKTPAEILPAVKTILG